MARLLLIVLVTLFFNSSKAQTNTLTFQTEEEITQYTRNSAYKVLNPSGDVIMEFDKTNVCFSVDFDTSNIGILYLFPCDYGHAKPESNGVYGFISKTGHILVEPQYKCDNDMFSSGISKYLFYTNRALVKSDHNRHIYVDSKGNKVLPVNKSSYAYATAFNNGMASVALSLADPKNILIDTSGNNVLAGVEYDHLGVSGISSDLPQIEGYFLIIRKNHSQFAVLDKNQKELFALNLKQNNIRYRVNAHYKPILINNQKEDGLLYIYKTIADEASLNSDNTKAIQHGMICGLNGNPYTDWIEMDLYENFSVLNSNIVLSNSQKTIDAIKIQQLQKHDRISNQNKIPDNFKFAFTKDDLIRIFNKNQANMTFREF